MPKKQAQSNAQPLGTGAIQALSKAKGKLDSWNGAKLAEILDIPRECPNPIINAQFVSTSTRQVARQFHCGVVGKDNVGKDAIPGPVYRGDVHYIASMSAMDLFKQSVRPFVCGW